MNKKYIEIPKVCPICGGETEIREDGIAKILYCTNPKCDGKFANIINHYCSKKGLDIKGFSLATINKLIDWGWIDSIKDIYTLKDHRDEWIQKPGFGPASVDKILAAIEKSCEFNLQRFIVAIGIPEIGTSASKELVKRYHTWHEFRAATYNELIDIPGFGDIMVDYILHYDYSEADEIVNKYMIQGIKTTKKDWEIISAHFKNKDTNEIVFADLINAVGHINAVSTEELKSVLSLQDKTFCITGRLSKSRSDISADIEAHGGKVIGSVSSKTDYLVIDDINSTTGKAKKARELGTKIISEGELYALIGGNNGN